MILIAVLALLPFTWQQGEAITPPPLGVGEGTAPVKTVSIDLKEQTLSAYEGDKSIYLFHCSTGKKNYATPKGDWKIRQKVRHNRALPQYGGGSIPFTLRLDVVIKGRRRRIAIHAYKNVPAYPASHGCIRLKHADAEKLFKWAEVGIVVTVK